MKWVTWLLNLTAHRASEWGSRTLLWVAEAYMIQVTNIQDRTGLTGIPLGVGLTIKLFIHEIAFVNIWPNQQARWVLWKYSQDSSDVRYNKCKHDAYEQINRAHSDNEIAMHGQKRGKSGGSPPEIPKIIYWVPNEGLNDSSRGKCKNNNAAVGRQGDTT